MGWKRLVVICLIMILIEGFRWEAGKRWNISPNQPTLWLVLDEKLYAEDGFGEKVKSLTGKMESLKDIPPAEQRIEVWRMILDEFASVETTFLKMRLKPGQIPAIDALNAEPYNEVEAEERTVTVEIGSSKGASSGYAQTNVSGNTIRGCKVVLAPRTLEDPQFYQHVLLHEILHCLEIKHQQDDSNSLMSYSNNSPGFSLEERMAITYLYPIDQNAAKESATFGLACSPRN